MSVHCGRTLNVPKNAQPKGVGIGFFSGELRVFGCSYPDEWLAYERANLSKDGLKERFSKYTLKEIRIWGAQ